MMSDTNTMHRMAFFFKSFCLLVLLLCCALITPYAASAAGRQQSTASSSIHKSANIAPVVIDGRILFSVVGLSTYPARQRAKKTAERIRALARDPSFDPATLGIREIDGILRIFANDSNLVAILEADAKIEGNFSPQVLASGLFLPKITRAIEDYRKEREREFLVAKGISALIRTVARSPAGFSLLEL